MSKFIQKKLNKRFPVIPGKVCIYLQKLKYIILAGIILLCFNGMYGFFSLNSPWAVFSKLRAFEFKNAFTVTGIILFILIITGMCIQERFFCQFLCPMGAVFALLPVITLQYPKKREDICLKGCKLCVKNCPVSINPGSRERIGECIGCNKCISVCSCAGACVASGLEDGKNRIDVNGDMCVSCGACFDVCEHSAREYIDDTEEFFAALKKGERISLLLAPAFKANYPNEYEKVLGGLKKAGINRIISVSFGADITTWGYLNYIQKIILKEAFHSLVLQL